MSSISGSEVDFSVFRSSFPVCSMGEAKAVVVLLLALTFSPSTHSLSTPLSPPSTPF